MFNCLHVRLDDPRIDLVGLRVPAYAKEAAFYKRVYWDSFDAAIQPLLAGPTVIIGDFNDPGCKHLRRLKEAGWQLPDPVGPWSFITTKKERVVSSRLDYALVAPGVTFRTAEYIASAPFAGPEPGHLSDHAPLVLEVTVQQSEDHGSFRDIIPEDIIFGG